MSDNKQLPLKKVIDIDNIKIIDVPLDYIECSVCGRYHAPSDYSEFSVISRTNCYNCYISPTKYWDERKAAVKAIKVSKIYKELERKLKLELGCIKYSRPVEEVIEELKKLPPGSHLIGLGWVEDSRWEIIEIPTPEKFEITGYYAIKI